MCGRLTLTQRELREVAALVGAEEPDAATCARYRPRYNVAPGQAHWIVVDVEGHRVLEPARFGLRSPRLKDGVAPFNARSETVMKVGAFREAMRAGRRGVVPADGYYEWTGPRSDRRPLRFVRRDGAILLFAAVWAPDARPGEAPEEATGEPGFAILTAAAQGELRQFHDRVPVILAADEVDRWLGAPIESAEDQAAITRLLATVPDGLLSWRAASKRVNRVANDDAACLEAEAAPEPVAEAKAPRRSGAKAGAGADTKHDRQLRLL